MTERLAVPRSSLAGSVGAAAYDDKERVRALADTEGDVASCRD